METCHSGLSRIWIPDQVENDTKKRKEVKYMTFRGKTPEDGRGPTPTGDSVERWLRNGGRHADDAVARRLLSQVRDEPASDRRSSSERLGSTLDPRASDPE